MSPVGSNKALWRVTSQTVGTFRVAEAPATLRAWVAAQLSAPFRSPAPC